MDWLFISCENKQRSFYVHWLFSGSLQILEDITVAIPLDLPADKLYNFSF